MIFKKQKKSYICIEENLVNSRKTSTRNPELIAHLMVK